MFDWRRKKATAGRKAGKKQPKSSDIDEVLVIPNHFRCPISLDLMKDPVTLSSGITYDRENIEKWLEAGNFTCPVTNMVLKSFDQVPNHTLRMMIQEWCVENKNYGVERIPTPRIPVTGVEVSQILHNLTALAKKLDQSGCLELLNKIKKWGFESERNKRCIVANGTAAVLASALDAFAAESIQKNVCFLEEILSSLNWMFPLDNEAQTSLRSLSSLRCMVWFMKNGDTSAKQNAVLVLKEISCDEQHYAETLMDLHGGEILFQFLKQPISRTITKASLMVIFSAISSNERVKSAFIEMGVAPLLLNLIIDGEKHVCEIALGVFDRLCDNNQMRQEAYENALTLPILVKKILRVSELATEYSVSTVWKLSKYEKQNEGRVLVEALQVGIFQKLVLLLQCGCEDKTKEKATELLKLLNPYRAGLECIESADFKNLKRSF
ncbi:RING-type E3 ubiquitin transferase [Melia azedarach]|uniref:RING-type E3 ubiquitin transferase n=1 Tax=Melia azedarach TaxID=155640 RepID=A0ACC1XR05_MELAZ|nr:RING-type E3 ubiquitin transferase [Melia azedarach]